MDHAIRCFDVRRRNDGTIHFGPAIKRDRRFAALYRLGEHAFSQIGRHDFARHHVVGQDRYQLVLVFRLQQVLNRASGQGRKRRIGGRENGERTLALQRLDKARRRKRRDQRGKVSCGNGGVDDVLLMAIRESRHGKGGGGGQRQKSSADHWCHSRLILVMPSLAIHIQLGRSAGSAIQNRELALPGRNLALGQGFARMISRRRDRQ